MCISTATAARARFQRGGSISAFREALRHLATLGTLLTMALADSHVRLPIVGGPSALSKALGE
jgi:hypothetical protein